MGFFERYLSVWVGLCIVAGVGLGYAMPGVFASIAALEYAHVNLIVAVLIWLMIYPMMVQIDFGSIKDVGKKPKGLVLTLVINWLIKPFTMALLGWLFFKGIFADWVDPQTATEYIAGMILLGVAPCTAMVFVWSHLTKGDANYTLVQVSINDLIMVVAFAPLTAMLLGVTDITVPWDTLLLSVALYVVLPLVAGYITRRHLENKGNNAQGNGAVDALVSKFKPFSVIGLLHYCYFVWSSGRNYFIAAARHRAYRDTATNTNLRYFCYCLLCRKTHETAAQCCSAGMYDWYVKLF